MKLAALSGLATAAYSEISRIRSISESIVTNRPPDSEFVIQRDYDQSHNATLARLSVLNKAAHDDRERYVEQMKALLAKHGDAPIGGKK